MVCSDNWFKNFNKTCNSLVALEQGWGVFMLQETGGRPIYKISYSTAAAGGVSNIA